MNMGNIRKFHKVTGCKRYRLFFRISVLFLFTSLIITSCDKINEPYIQRTNNQTDTGVVVQKVLLEDFTGHRCGNCPRAHEKIEELHGLYGDKVITIAVHAGFFAMTTTEYPTDYRSADGNAIASYFSVTDYPSGMVNRKEESGQRLKPYTVWATMISEILAQTPVLGISITNNYNSTNRQLQSTAKLEFKGIVDEQLKICFFITEDSLISPQTDYSLTPDKIDNYIHRHVLRGSMNGTWGDNLSASSYSAGDSLTVTKTVTLNSNWNENHCSVVVFVYSESSEEIVQAEEKKVR